MRRRIRMRIGWIEGRLLRIWDGWTIVGRIRRRIRLLEWDIGRIRGLLRVGREFRLWLRRYHMIRRRT